MAEYKVIFRADVDHPNDQHGITWEQGCPLMFEAIQISRETESGKAFLQTKVRNLSGAIVSSFKAKLTCHYKDGSTEKFEIEPLDADIAPCGEYALKPIALSRGDAAYAEAFVLSVDMSDGNWTSTATACPLPRRNPLALSADALNERISLLRERGCNKPCEAAPYSYVEHDEWSQCPCGQVSIGCRACPSCGLRLARVEETESEEFLKEAIEKRAARLEKAAEEKKRQQIETRTKTRKLTMIGGSIAAVLACITLFFNWILPDVIQPAVSYSEASKMLEEQGYGEAYGMFIELGDYNDSRDKAHAAASGLLGAGEYDAAIKAFQNLAEYEDSAEKVEEAENGLRFVKAKELVSLQKYADAIGVLTCITKRTTESSALLDEAYGKDAERLFRSGDIGSAVERIESMESKTWEVNKIMEEIASFESKYGKWLGKWCYSDEAEYSDTTGEWVYDQKDIEITITAKYSDGLELCVKKGDGSSVADKAYELKKTSEEKASSYELGIEGEDRLVLTDTHTRFLTDVAEGEIEETFPGGRYRKTLSKIDGGWY